MTLKETLDGKLPKLSTLAWKELEIVFLEVKPEDLLSGVKVSVYQNDPKSHFSYLLESSENHVGKKFPFCFNFDTLKEVIKIAKENGLTVKTISEGSHYVFIYSPNWPNK